MKLYDFNTGASDVRVPCTVVESFDGAMHHMSTYGVTKSFNKAKKEALNKLYRVRKDLDELISEIEKLEESDVYHRGCF